MKVYKVTAEQIYYVEADSPEQAQIYFIDDDEKHVGIGFTEITGVEEVDEE